MVVGCRLNLWLKNELIWFLVAVLPVRFKEFQECCALSKLICMYGNKERAGMVLFSTFVQDMEWVVNALYLRVRHGKFYLWISISALTKY